MDTFITTETQCLYIPVTNANGSEWRTIYNISVEHVKKGDMLQVFGEGQARNDLGYNVELAQIIEIKTRQQISDGNETINRIFQSPINGWNIAPAVHYGRFSKMASWTSDNDYNQLYIMLRLRCKSTGAQNGHIIEIQPTQGNLFVNHFSKQ